MRGIPDVMLCGILVKVFLGVPLAVGFPLGPWHGRLQKEGSELWAPVLKVIYTGAVVEGRKLEYDRLLTPKPRKEGRTASIVPGTWSNFLEPTANGPISPFKGALKGNLGLSRGELPN